MGVGQQLFGVEGVDVEGCVGFGVVVFEGGFQVFGLCYCLYVVVVVIGYGFEYQGVMFGEEGLCLFQCYGVFVVGQYWYVVVLGQYVGLGFVVEDFELFGWCVDEDQVCGGVSLGEVGLFVEEVVVGVDGVVVLCLCCGD